MFGLSCTLLIVRSRTLHSPSNFLLGIFPSLPIDIENASRTSSDICKGPKILTCFLGGIKTSHWYAMLMQGKYRRHTLPSHIQDIFLFMVKLQFPECHISRLLYRLRGTTEKSYHYIRQHKSVYAFAG